MIVLISEETIQKAVDLLREAAKPRKIILYGSYASGEATDESDLDLLVIEDEVPDVTGEMVRLMRVLGPLIIPAEVLVIGTADFEEWSRLPCSVYRDAAETGKVLYEAA